MKHPRIGWLLIGISMAFQASAAPAAAPLLPQSRAATAAPVSARPAAAALRQDMRKLWTDHVVWTRDDIIAAVAISPTHKPRRVA
jgi:hypothetical protein